MIICFESDEKAHPAIKTVLKGFCSGAELALQIKHAVITHRVAAYDEMRNWKQQAPNDNNQLPELLLLRDGLWTEDSIQKIMPLLTSNLFFVIHHQGNGTKIYEDNEALLKQCKPDAHWFFITQSHLEGDFFFEELPLLITETGKPSGKDMHAYYKELLKVYSRFRNATMETYIKAMEHAVANGFDASAVAESTLTTITKSDSPAVMGWPASLEQWEQMYLDMQTNLLKK